MPEAAKLKVVVVDDQASIRGLVRAGLNSIGITDVSEYGAAADALAHVKGRASNIVISDFNMPEMDGLQFLQAMRTMPQCKSTVFILLTGRADKELVQRAVKLGANNYVVKPFTISVLKQKIEQVIGALT
jgi:two-component system chemotaxis response regulator CheY